MIPENTIVNGNCIAGIRLWPSECVNLVVSDPPYLINDQLQRSLSSGGKSDNGLQFEKSIMNSQNYDLIKDYFKEIYRILKDDSAAYIFSSPMKIDYFLYCAKSAGFTFKNVIVWEKNNHTTGDLGAAYGFKWEAILYFNKGRRKINGKRLNDVWRFPATSPSKQMHQHQKPIPLLMRCISKSSDEGDLVFDGFMGSGSTAIAALNTGRKFVGYELDPIYFDTASKRLDSVKKRLEKGKNDSKQR